MPSSDISPLFIYNDSFNLTGFFGHMYYGSELQLFNTDNLYKLLQYRKELFPKILLINQPEDEKSLPQIFDYLDEQNLPYSPIIIIVKNSTQKFLIDRRISHYLTFPQDKKKFRDIMESYDLGHKNPQILLLSSFNPQTDKLHSSLSFYNLSYFETHTIAAAALYLQKNQPLSICIEAVPQFSDAAQIFNSHRIFYVDSTQDITEIKKFLN